MYLFHAALSIVVYVLLSNEETSSPATDGMTVGRKAHAVSKEVAEVAEATPHFLANTVCSWTNIRFASSSVRVSVRTFISAERYVADVFVYPCATTVLKSTSSS